MYMLLSLFSSGVGSVLPGSSSHENVRVVGLRCFPLSSQNNSGN
jgi:hypothetical protein